MSLGYRAVLTTEATNDHLEKILEIVRKWLVGKKRFPNLPESGSVENRAGSTLKASKFHVDDVLAYRWELLEAWDSPKWYSNTKTSRLGLTHITLVYSRGSLWIWVDVQPPTLRFADSAGREQVDVQSSGTPAFVKALIDELPFRDGLAEPISTFQLVVTPSHVAELVTVVQDSSRVGTVYVSATPSDAIQDVWSEKSARLVGEMQGMGVGYVLGTEATREFNSIAGSAHYVPSGGMRTFLPGAQFNDPSDGYSHKLLYPSTIRDTDERRLARILRGAQVARLGTIRLPRLLRDVDYEFLRMERLKPFEPVAQTESLDSSDDSALMVAVNVQLVEKLKAAERDAYEFLESNYLQKEAVELLQLEAEDLRQAVGYQYSELSTARDLIESLRKRLLLLGSAEGTDAAFAPLAEEERTEYPATFKELVDRIDELPGVLFLGERDDAEALDTHASLGETVVMKAWDALSTFNAYVKSRDESGYENGLGQYIKHAHHGHHMRISQVSWSEGQTVRTNDAMASQRTVSGVPTSISESGVLEMWAHIPLATRRANSPRLYFTDAYSTGGVVAVGYLGGHLDNASSN